MHEETKVSTVSTPGHNEFRTGHPRNSYNYKSY